MQFFRFVSDTVLERVEDFDLLDAQGKFVVKPDEDKGCWMNASVFHVDPLDRSWEGTVVRD